MMSGRAHERENRLAARDGRLDRGDRAPGRAPRCRERVPVDDDVAGRKIARRLCPRDLALNELEIRARVNPLDLLVDGVARRNRLR
jgi:hypothetical protein